MNTVGAAPIRIGFVLHIMQVAGAEVLVAETIRRLRPHLDPVVFCLDGVGQLGELLQAEGVPVVPLGRRPGLDARVVRRLAGEIRSRRLELVHAHQYTPFFYSALAKTIVGRRVYLMFTEHGRHYPDVVSRKRRLVNRCLLSRLANEVNGVCGFSVRSLAEVDGFGGRSLEVIPNGIDLERYGPARDQSLVRASLGLDPERRVLACVARFHPVKDHQMLLRAFAGVAQSCPDVDLLLAGDGPLRGELQVLAESLGLAGRVRFLGVRNDVPDILAAADVFALTSVSEAASITLLEAMASGLPVLVTNVGGNPDIVRPGVDGILVERGDVQATSAAMLRLLNDPSNARTMGANGRERVRDRFQLERTVHTYLDRYWAAAEGLRRGRTERRSQ